MGDLIHYRPFHYGIIMVWHIFFNLRWKRHGVTFLCLSSHLSLLHVESILLLQNLYLYSLASILNNSLPTNYFSSQNIPKTNFVMVWHLMLPLSSVLIFVESIHIISICNLSYDWCIEKELNEVQGFMILISFYFINDAFGNSVFHVTPRHFTFFEAVFMNTTLLFHNKSIHSSF